MYIDSDMKINTTQNNVVLFNGNDERRNQNLSRIETSTTGFLSTSVDLRVLLFMMTPYDTKVNLSMVEGYLTWNVQK